jgi:hypothetical protein
MPPLEPDERGRSDGLMGYVAGVIRGQLRKRKTSSYRLPELVRPDGAGYMALYCAAQWIATRGGTLEINPLDDLAVPVQPLLEGSSRPYAMFKDYWKYEWVLPVYRYEGLEPLLATLAEKVIAPAEGKVRALQERRRMIEAELTKPQ